MQSSLLSSIKRSLFPCTIKEAMVPFIFMRRRKKQVDETLKKTSTVEKVEYFNKEVDSELQKQVNLEITMDEYEVCV
jgi:hypothetical protein